VARPRFTRQELFMALPRIADLKGSAVVERVLRDLYARAAGNAFEERMILRDEADFREKRGQLDRAIALSERVLATTQQLGAGPGEVRQDLMNLILRRLASTDVAQRERADREIDDIARGAADETLAQVLLGRVTATLDRAGVRGRLPGELDDSQRDAVAVAERDVAAAAGCTLSDAQAGQILHAKTAICRVTGRDEEGLAATAEAIAYFRERLPASSLPPTVWTDRLELLNSLYQYRTSLLIRARPPRLREAFECADESRAQLLRHELAWANMNAEAQEGRPSYDALRALLARDEAALVLFDVRERSSAVFVVDPAQADPIHRQIDLTSDELAGLMPGQETMSYAKKQVFAALAPLSGKLIPALADVIKRYRLLYLIPTAALYGVPFAALTLPDGSRLVEHCAIAYVPSASMLAWSTGRRRARHSRPERTLVALGVGGTKDGEKQVSFAAQAKDVVDTVDTLGAISGVLLPEDTTATALLDAAEAASILHLECHGSLDPTASALTASYLELSDRAHLTTQDVADRAGRLDAELVFLNACLSGTFASRMSNEAGGFWQAFFIGGSSSLVATLTSVRAQSASELVLGFYEAWLGRGLDKARALQAAQLAMLAAGRAAQDWATHILIGDAR
jgi:CHAT domain-containing protein